MIAKSIFKLYLPHCVVFQKSVLEQLHVPLIQLKAKYV